MDLFSALLILGLVCLALVPFAVPGLLEVLLSLAVSALLVAGALYIGWLPDELWLSLLSLAVLAVVTALVLWKPLRRLQHTGERLQEDKGISDFVGTQLVLAGHTSKTQASELLFSGVHWQVKLDPDSSDAELVAGEQVVISSAQVGLLLVKKING